MINKYKWINSLPKTNETISKTTNQLDHEMWVNTIPKKGTYNSVKKYSFMTILFVCGLLFVSIVKNETRNLQKEINNLKTSINLIKFNLEQSILDHEVITSPENISLLAKEHLNIELVTYERSQIKKLSEINDIKTNENSQVFKDIKEKKTGLKKIKEIYSNPKSLPAEIKTKVAKRIEEKKIGLKTIYNSPKDTINLEKAGKYALVQLVKAFLGMPIIPGR